MGALRTKHRLKEPVYLQAKCRDKLGHRNAGRKPLVVPLSVLQPGFYVLLLPISESSASTCALAPLHWTATTEQNGREKVRNNGIDLLITVTGPRMPFGSLGSAVGAIYYVDCGTNF